MKISVAKTSTRFFLNIGKSDEKKTNFAFYTGNTKQEKRESENKNQFREKLRRAAAQKRRF